MTPLIRFYRGEAPDSEGRWLRDIRAWDHRQLEAVHDYIQWLFPLRTRSQFNANAPTLDDPQIECFRADEKLRAELLTSFRQMLDFYGFALRPEDKSIGPALDWEARSRYWLRPNNHNLLRITRILTCLTTLGLPEYARAFLIALEDVCAESPGNVGSRTLEFWRGAVRAS